MKQLVVVVILSVVIGSNSRAQDSIRLERIEYVIGGAATLSLLDYLGYNLINSIPPGKSYDHALLAVHVLDALAGAGIMYVLYRMFGLPTVGSFDLIWWTWGVDMGFYGWTYLLNPASPW